MSFGASTAARAGGIEATTTTPPTRKAPNAGAPSARQGVDDEGCGPDESELSRREQVKGRGRVRGVDPDDIDAGRHLIETLPIGGSEVLLALRRYAATVLVVDLQAEGAGAPAPRLADPP